MSRQRFDLPVPPHLVGDNKPSVVPGGDPAFYGTATLSPTDSVTVRSHQCFTLEYTVGSLGIDDTGGIRVAWRSVGDSGLLQTTDASAPNFVTAESNGEGRLTLSYDRIGGLRPWGEILTIVQNGGYLRPGDLITVRIGDTRQGGPGWLMQTFAEAGRDFLVMADVQATGNFQPLPDTQLSVPIRPGPPALWKAVLPSLRRPGEPFFLGIKAEDSWGNPTVPEARRLRLAASQPVDNLPESVAFDGVAPTVAVEGLACAKEGVVTVEALGEDGPVAVSNPLLVREGDHAGYWGDLHGQSGETIGVGRIEDYMNFARNKAFLEVCCHQGNDFQIKDVFWEHLNKVAAEWNEPGRFTMFPGYEWSGNTAVGGDRNVIYSQEGCALRRCSHALIEDRHDIADDAHDLTALYAAIRKGGEDTVVFAHVGGRYADISYDFDPQIETAVEVHSDWGTFEWIAHDSFRLGRRVGIVANSDGHKGRPGASYPGVSEFGAYGGLTCFLAAENTREALFEAIRRRHHYATTGCRIALSVRAALAEPARIHHRDPAGVADAPWHEAGEAMMGDIVETSAGEAAVGIVIHAHSGIERVELRRGEELVETVKPHDASALGNRLRVLWSGAEYRGRGRNTSWQGEIDTGSAKITSTTPISRWNPESLFEQRSDSTFAWEGITTGNSAGVDLVLDSLDTDLSIATNHGTLSVRPAELGLEDAVLDCGGLERQLRVVRLPDGPLPRSWTLDRTVALDGRRDSPVWIRVTTEDGHHAWSTPIYFIHGQPSRGKRP